MKEQDEFVYAIHGGSIHEGGSVYEIYADPEKAIKFALMAVERKNQKAYQIHGPGSEENYYEENWKMKEKVYDFPTPHILKVWQNCIDELVIYKYKLIK